MSKEEKKGGAADKNKAALNNMQVQTANPNAEALDLMRFGLFQDENA